MLTYESGSIQDAMAAEALIPEFDSKKSQVDFANKLEGKNHLILIARDNGQPVGFKIGYQLSDHQFYSWLGGVAPDYRGQGVARKLRELQKSWAFDNGYTSIQVKSKNRFPAMLQMLISSGYKICGYEDLGSIDDNKIHFIKGLNNN
ncbi:GNAT family N-acetyltransferase [Sansalvadorimonas sp. 2012CJ34-2]|uniref:GNAT family N-acetyltransferase n=1 Tax=Parendozoicomonas callyspongiae TaxID=2942213 RepID=A0ABT0PCJ4_9GAMM|nr:GNAT family N-acetyltransferase [Sansalvadorimonas sp. 2012CJ34-2]MCL6269069.1 GNAT family N-acetyltransferase [Sansalvadorimonas sp. 2012CJ34-2]